jgi:A/G-specific adenine glycosylase
MVARRSAGLVRKAPRRGTSPFPRETIPSVRRKLLRWYARAGRQFSWRKPRATHFERILSEILLQRTKAERVGELISGFMNTFRDWSAIAGAPMSKLSRELKPFGLWRRRSVSLSILSKIVSKQSFEWPSTRSELEKLPGVGQYIASAVLTFEFQQREPLLDGGMARVIERMYGKRKLADIRYDPWLQEVARILVDSKRSAELSWALLDLSATVCKQRNPACKSCPVREHCKSRGKVK